MAYCEVSRSGIKLSKVSGRPVVERHDETEALSDISFFYFKQKTAYEMLRSLVGSEMGIRDSTASERGHYIAYQAAHIAAKHSITVTSGMAKGPQSMAHRGAIEGGGNTIAVLPMGLLHLSIPQILQACVDPASYTHLTLPTLYAV